MSLFTFHVPLFSNWILGADPILSGTSWKVCPSPSASVTRILTTPTVPANKPSGGLTGWLDLLIHLDSQSLQNQASRQANLDWL